MQQAGPFSSRGPWRLTKPPVAQNPLLERVVRHVVQRIQATQLARHPYPYLYVEEVFPPAFYRGLRAFLPPPTSPRFRPLSEVYSDRRVYDLFDGGNGDQARADFTDLDQTRRAFWRLFQEAFLVDTRIKEAFIDKYQAFIHCPDLEHGYLTARVSRDLPGYAIGSHRDRRDKVFSAIFFLPRWDTSSTRLDWGTRILKPKDSSMPHTDEHHPFDRFDTVRVAECRPNALFSWVVCADSYHGVAPIQSDGVRETLAYFFKIPKACESRHILYGEPGFGAALS